jgi:hypothetical protein
VVQREGVKFRDSGSKIERNIEKHQICHTLPERSVGTSLWRPKIFIMGIVFFARGQICLDLFVSAMFWREPRAKNGQKKMVQAKSGQKKRWCGQKAGKKKDGAGKKRAKKRNS